MMMNGCRREKLPALAGRRMRSWSRRLRAVSSPASARSGECLRNAYATELAAAEWVLHLQGAAGWMATPGLSETLPDGRLAVVADDSRDWGVGCGAGPVLVARRAAVRSGALVGRMAATRGSDPGGPWAEPGCSGVAE